ncbi:FAD-binding protein [Thauera linaloolentis]|uniref:FAD dependent oxidoreductase n=1 Tax=Thauera linaloolentis (strain DSM 12138 / JCM 21573 / CCUG 41526 / CIP 105981 / IAM 15112 / NBRC 102519 / 47Lol) TaxID=1123367 RepID=N6XSF4_THAL4|nr:FAD-binding protein [Thauera linaloolentis]ENO84676.1 FAD dependent oxidoreductase [Thauera linaloolentis 47Lol = DSM 12138]MCM8564250.1 FAD-binding protein [Thauera linaloolentis]
MSFYPQQQTVDGDSHDLHLRTDVLVVGGSIAGCWAALAARRAGAGVILAEKGYVGTAGVVAAATAGGAHTVPGKTEHNDKVVNGRRAVAGGVDDPVLARRVYDETYRISLRLQEMGFEPNPGRPGASPFGGEPRLTSFNGPYSLHFLRTALLKAGVRILDHSPALELLAADGVVTGAAGVNRQSEQSWAVRAGAVILATGGNAFRSGAMGTNGVTGDGHLFGAEAGARLVGMEFSGHYGIAPAGSQTTKGFWYGSATFYDGAGRELPVNGWGAVPDVARAVMETGGAWATINRGGPDMQRFARRTVNLFQFFDRAGIDPFKDRFPLTLLYEGHVRGVGGLVVDDTASTGVPGLYAAGDVTDRTHMTGAQMSGAGPAVSWCLASGEWAGAAASAFAAGPGRALRRHEAVGLGGLGLRAPSGSACPTNALHDLRAAVQAEILPIEKNVFRSLDGIDASTGRLDGLWERHRGTLLGGGVREVVLARETAALLAGARWLYRAARQRTETRGLHRLRDHPASDAAQRDRIVLAGVDGIRLAREPLRAQAGQAAA